jgi:Ca2+-binding RTX toxin-like protein
MPNIVKGTNASEVINALDGVTTGNDEIYGFGGNDTIFALNGMDAIFGGDGADKIDGGDGYDTAIYTDSKVGVQASLADGKGYGGTAEGDTYVNVENLAGSDFDDLLVGDNAQNVLSGNKGNDVLKGGGGTDHLWGEEGNDILNGGAGGDKLYGEYGIDTASYADSNAGVLVNLDVGGFGGHAQGDSYFSIENVDGSAYDDFLLGSSGANGLFGLGGKDQIDGGQGDDLIEGGADGDSLTGGDGIDTLSYAQSKAAVVINLGNGTAQGGDAANDSFIGFENVTGSKFADAIFGDGLANVLKGGKGADSIFGGLNNDVVEGGWDGDTLDGGDGSDTLSYAGSAAGVVVNLGNGMALGGDAANDSFTSFENLLGSAQADSLFGDGLANRIEGGDGADFLFGGLNSDVFVFTGVADNAVKWQDTVLDFVVGQDKIELSASEYKPEWLDFMVGQVGNDTVVNLYAGGTIVLKDVDASTLTANDFLFV